MRTVADLVAGKVTTVSAQASPLDAALAMERSGARSLVVIDARGEVVGILTERDLLARVLAEGRDPKAVRIEQVMSSPFRSVQAGEGLPTAIELMKSCGIRQLPVLEDGALVGMISLDHLLEDLSRQLAVLSGGMKARRSEARSHGRDVGRRASEEEQVRAVRARLEAASAHEKKDLEAELRRLEGRLS